MSNQPIRFDPKIMMGKPVVAGTRITVEQILDAHLRLTGQAIQAAIEFAATR